MHEEKPVDTNKTGDRHMATQIVPTDVSCTVPIYESYTLHRAITEYIMKRFSLYPRGSLLWTSQRNSASWHALRHSTHDRCISQKEDQRAHRQHLHCWRQTPPLWSLPASLLRDIWLCQLDSGVYAVALWSFVFHGLWLGASAVVSLILESDDRQIRGWARLLSVGAMNSVLYPLLLRHPGFW